MKVKEMERNNEIIEYTNPSGEIKEHTFEEMETSLRFESCDEDFHIKCSQEIQQLKCSRKKIMKEPSRWNQEFMIQICLGFMMKWK